MGKELEQKKRIANVVTIAGVDPSGGAGVLADVKAMSAMGCFACAVIAALTAQNTRDVTGVMPVPPEFVVEQIDTLFEDVRIDAVKVGMLGSSEIMTAVAGALRKHKPRVVVLDTVMVAKSGAKLMPDDAVETFKRELLPLADIITPNLPEAGVILGREITKREEMEQAARDLFAMCGGKCAVYLKGGHLEEGDAEDLLFDGKTMHVLTAARVDTKNTHGTGCTLSSAIAAAAATENDIVAACRRAKDYLSMAISRADELDVGSGHGPVHHFAGLWG